ncbi:MAG: 50S ribosomal protein L10 [Armatimonadetes bacterium]|nr:50S ribosomal protein L10 [Armatimonadota bacterium]
MPNPQKTAIVEELKEKIAGSKAIVVADYRTMKVSDMAALREKLRPLQSECKVAKNTLFRLAGGDGIPEGLMPHLEGPSAFIFVPGDPVDPAKAVADFQRDHRAFTIKGGMLDGKFMTAEQVQALSKMPTREVMISQMLGSIQSPLTGLVGTLQGVISNLVFTLQAVVDKRQPAA